MHEKPAPSRGGWYDAIMQRAVRRRNSPPLSVLSPGGRPRLRDAPGGVEKLASLEIGCGELVPPMITHTVCRRAAQLARGVAARWVHGSHRDAIARGLHRELQITVIADHHSRIDASFEHVEQQMRSHVDIRALLLAPGHRHHEH